MQDNNTTTKLKLQTLIDKAAVRKKLLPYELLEDDRERQSPLPEESDSYISKMTNIEAHSVVL